MRTITTTTELYTFDELSANAQENALDNFCCNEEFGDGEEYRATIDEIENTFGINIKIGQEQAGYISFCLPDFCITEEEITDPIRVAKWFINNHYNDIVKGKYYHTSYKDKDGTYKSKDKYSKVLMDHNGCPLCGTWCEGNFIKVLDDVITYKKFYNSIKDVFYDAISALFKGYQADWDYFYSMENFRELAECNDWEFDEDGERY